MINIQFAKEEDFSKFREFDPHSKYIDPKRILNKIINNEVILAKEDNKIVGLIKFSYIWSTRPYMEYIFVEDSLRNKGIGKKLLPFFFIRGTKYKKH